MSLVLDALNKANKEKKENNFDPRESFEIDKVKSKHRKKLFIILSINMIIILMLVLVIVYGIKNYNRSNQEGIVVPVKKTLNQSVRESEINVKINKKDINPVPEEVVTKLKVAKPVQSGGVKIKRKYFKADDGYVLNLNGTYIDQNEAFVLFEEDMFKAGDVIDEKVLILSVTKKNVKIQYKGVNYDIPN